MNLTIRSLSACAALVFTGHLSAALIPPTVGIGIQPPSLYINEEALATFTLTNPNAATLTGVAFTTTLSPTLFTDGLTTSTCTGLSLSVATNTILVSGVTLFANSSCHFSIRLGSKALGDQSITASAPSSNEAPTGFGAGAGDAITLTVLAPVDSFQVRYAANLNIGDSVINITNTGGNVSGNASQNICANLFTFDPAEELISCCACSVTPNGLQSLSVIKSLISNPLTPAVPTSVVVKVVATAGTCNAAAIDPRALAHGLLAWGTTVHQNTTTVNPSYFGTETAFSSANLTAPELAHITSTCSFIQANGSGFGICKGCAAGGLGAGTSNQ
jgi:hypothetical protein